MTGDDVEALIGTPPSPRYLAQRAGVVPPGEARGPVWLSVVGAVLVARSGSGMDDVRAVQILAHGSVETRQAACACALMDDTGAALVEFLNGLGMRWERDPLGARL